ncbi:MAG: SHOCT domain-containing protein [Planctomycetota bacterium]
MIPPAMLTTQSASNGSIWLPLGLLIAAVMVGGFIVLALRRRFLNDSSGPAQTPGGLLDEMRRMHEAGELSDEEYDRVRRRLARKAAGPLTSQALSPNAPQADPHETPDHNNPGAPPPDSGGGPSNPS